MHEIMYCEEQIYAWEREDDPRNLNLGFLDDFMGGCGESVYQILRTTPNRSDCVSFLIKKLRLAPHAMVVFENV